MGLIEREPPQAARRRDGDKRQRPSHLVAACALLAGDLGVGAAGAGTHGNPRAKARADPLASGKLRVALGVGAPAAAAAVAALSPAKACEAARERQILDRDHRPLLHLERRRVAMRTALGPFDRLHLDRERAVVALAHVGHLQPGKPEGSGKFVRHPPSLPLRDLEHREA
jgi:hypothetical protein